jgi:hypothetical protein
MAMSLPDSLSFLKRPSLSASVFSLFSRESNYLSLDIYPGKGNGIKKLFPSIVDKLLFLLHTKCPKNSELS